MGARIFRRNPWIAALAASPFAIALFAIVSHLLGASPLFLLTPHFVIIGIIASVAAWRRKPFAKSEDVQVSVDDETLRVGEVEIARASITSAQLVPAMSGKPTFVRVSSKLRPDIDVAVSEDDEAHDLLRALGQDPSQTTATFRGGSLAVTRYRWALFGLLIPAAVLFGIFSRAIGPVALPFFLTLLAPALWPSWLTIGADGVLLRWMWTRTFIATKDIQLVTRFERGSGRNRIRGISILTGEGKTIEVPLGDEDKIAIVRQRIEEVIELAKTGAHVADDALLLSRGDLSVRAWLTRLRALGEGATAQLRVAPIMPERLWRVALDPVAPAPSRVAAAVALSGQLDDDGRSKLAEAAKATAAPKLRVALETVARGATDDEMEAAIAEIDEAK